MASVVFAGELVGTMVFGWLADHIGRRVTFLLSLIAILVAGIFSCFSPGFEFFVACRCFVGFGVGGFAVPFDLLAEFLPPEKRGSTLIVRTCGCVCLRQRKSCGAKPHRPAWYDGLPRRRMSSSGAPALCCSLAVRKPQLSAQRAAGLEVRSLCYFASTCVGACLSRLGRAANTWVAVVGRIRCAPGLLHALLHAHGTQVTHVSTASGGVMLTTT